MDKKQMKEMKKQEKKWKKEAKKHNYNYYGAGGYGSMPPMYGGSPYIYYGGGYMPYSGYYYQGEPGMDYGYDSPYVASGFASYPMLYQPQGYYSNPSGMMQQPYQPGYGYNYPQGGNNMGFQYGNYQGPYGASGMQPVSGGLAAPVNPQMHSDIPVPPNDPQFYGGPQMSGGANVPMSNDQAMHGGSSGQGDPTMHGGPPIQGGPYMQGGPPTQGGPPMQGGPPVQNQMTGGAVAISPQYRGTIIPDPNFNAENDAQKLRTAMRGLGTDEKAIIDVLAYRSAAQRQQIFKMYKTMFGKDLVKDIKSELSGNFEDVVLALLAAPHYYEAYCLNKAMSGPGTKEGILTEILTTRSNREINLIKDAYKQHFNRDLEKEVYSETSGYYRRVLISCCQGSREELTPEQWQILQQQGPAAIVDHEMAKREANELYNAGEKKFGTDESCFIRIIALRNPYQLQATFEEYEKVSSKTILQSIDSEMSGDVRKALKTMALAQTNQSLYFAKRLYKSMKGLGTKDNTLIRVVVSRSEIDLQDIKEEFMNNYKQTLAKFISDDTSRDYRRILLAIVGN